MEFKKGVDVYSSDDEKVGSLLRVVMDPKTRKVSHLVVKEGILFTEDKVVPIELVESVSHERITMKEIKENLDDLPMYEETHYIPIDEAGDYPESVYWYPPVDMYWGRFGDYPVFPESQFVQRTATNIPEGTVGLMEGAKVIAADDEKVGEIESMIANPRDKRITHLVVSGGLLGLEKRIIPVHWLSTVREDEVFLSVDSRFWERLPEYHPQP